MEDKESLGETKRAARKAVQRVGTVVPQKQVGDFMQWLSDLRKLPRKEHMQRFAEMQKQIEQENPDVSR